MGINNFSKIFFNIIFTLIFINISTYSVKANVSEVSSSAILITNKKEVTFDERPIILKRFLEKYNSPLSDYSENFVKYADEYDLDWRLVPSITGVESSFGKHIPHKSFNAYGWNNGNYYFESWDDSINHVSKTLKEKYVDDGLNTVEEIGGRYASSPTWSYKVKLFMKQIDPYTLEFTL